MGLDGEVTTVGRLLEEVEEMFAFVLADADADDAAAAAAAAAAAPTWACLSGVFLLRVRTMARSPSTMWSAWRGEFLGDGEAAPPVLGEGTGEASGWSPKSTSTSVLARVTSPPLAGMMAPLRNPASAPAARSMFLLTLRASCGCCCCWGWGCWGLLAGRRGAGDGEAAGVMRAEVTPPLAALWALFALLVLIESLLRSLVTAPGPPAGASWPLPVLRATYRSNAGCGGSTTGSSPGARRASKTGGPPARPT
jgi:hypothetical protein